MPQQFQVDRTLPVTVADFLALTQTAPSRVFRRRRATTRTRIALLLERVGLSGFADRPLSALSGGELRRVLLANALDPLPELLILDEPASGLDERRALARRHAHVLQGRDDGVDGVARFRAGAPHRRSRARY